MRTIVGSAKPGRSTYGHVWTGSDVRRIVRWVLVVVAALVALGLALDLLGIKVPWSSSLTVFFATVVGILGTVLVVGFLGLGIASFIRYLGGSDSAGEETALDILKKRYARGEINQEEYEQKKRDLGA